MSTIWRETGLGLWSHRAGGGTSGPGLTSGGERGLGEVQQAESLAEATHLLDEVGHAWRTHHRVRVRPPGQKISPSNATEQTAETKRNAPIFNKHRYIRPQIGVKVKVIYLWGH